MRVQGSAAHVIGRCCATPRRAQPLALSAQLRILDIPWCLTADHCHAWPLLQVDEDLRKTPLHVAAQRGNQAWVQMLIWASADPNILDDLGCSPIHYSQLCEDENYVECTEVLKSAGCKGPGRGSLVQLQAKLETMAAPASPSRVGVSSAPPAAAQAGNNLAVADPGRGRAGTDWGNNSKGPPGGAAPKPAAPPPQAGPLFRTCCASAGACGRAPFTGSSTIRCLRARGV